MWICKGKQEAAQLQPDRVCAPPLDPFSLPLSRPMRSLGPWRVAVPSKPYKCSTCGKRFCSTESLRVHLYYMHRAIKMHVCQGCGRCYKKRYDLRKHWERSPLCDELGAANL